MTVSSRQPRTPRVATSLAVTVFTVAGSLFALAAESQASPRPVTDSTASLCKGVSPSAISSIVGHSVPAATSQVTHSAFNKKLGISETDTTCTYGGAATSLAAMADTVTLNYGALSATPSESAVESELKSSFQSEQSKLPKGSKFKWSVTTVNGLPTIWAEVSATEDGITFDFQFLYGWKSDKVAGAFVETSMPKSELQKLEQLALNNFGV